ncbi:MAG: class I SAM-dependent methyltransferase [Bacteroidales bacterium]|nr:class I SAM-dependent methyltransferase [Bacteroidales bacterium]
MKQNWNQRFSAEGYIYGELPNVFLKEQLMGLPAGKILFPGEGEGRNAVWAALQGWQVEAVDYSEAGKEKALALAQRMGTELVAYHIEDLNLFEPLHEHYDAIAMIFVHLAAAERQQLHRKLIAALKPGGTFLLEAFSKKQLAFNSGGPKDEAMLYDVAMLRDDFSALRIHLLEEQIGFLDEGTHHRGEASTLKMLAMKP